MPAQPLRVPTPSYPITEYPSPVLDDLIRTERHDHTLARTGPNNLYESPPDYGTEHPNKPGFRLVNVKLVEPERWYDWTYVNDRSDQDSYNYELTYPDGDPDYPLVQRTYLIRRTEYEPLAEGTADPNTTDFPGAVLIRQRLVRMDDPVLDGLYVLVQRWFTRVPGKTTSSGANDGGEEAYQKYRIIVRTFRQTVADNTVLPIVGSLAASLFPDFAVGQKLEWGATAWSAADTYILSARLLPIEDSDTYSTMVCEVGCKPPTRYEFPSLGFVFPGVFNYLLDWFESPTDGFATPKPWAGVHYTTIAPKSMTPTARVTYDYFIEGAEPTMPEKFRVVSPAAASRFFRDLPYNMIHNGVTVIEIPSVGSPAIVETFPASTPATYDPGDVLLINCEDQTWRGLIKERQTVEVSEQTSPYDFS